MYVVTVICDRCGKSKKSDKRNSSHVSISRLGFEEIEIRVPKRYGSCNYLICKECAAELGIIKKDDGTTRKNEESKWEDRLLDIVNEIVDCSVDAAMNR